MCNLENWPISQILSQYYSRRSLVYQAQLFNVCLALLRETLKSQAWYASRGYFILSALLEAQLKAKYQKRLKNDVDTVCHKSNQHKRPHNALKCTKTTTRTDIITTQVSILSLILGLHIMIGDIKVGFQYAVIQQGSDVK